MTTIVDMSKYGGEKFFSDAWIHNVCELIATATPKKRREIKERIERAIAYEDARYVVEGYADCSKAIEFEGYCWGKNYLYVWFDKDGKPFYVGQGMSSNRIFQFEYKTRSEEFQQKIKEGGCHSVMVAKHINSDEIDELEKNLIAYLVWKGYCLVNKRDMPTREQLTLWTVFQNQKDGANVRKLLGEEAYVLYREWCSTTRKIAPIVEVLDSVIGVPWDGETAEFKPKLGYIAETFSWNGQEKTWREWAEEQGCTVTSTTIKNRIEKGWTMAEALFTPSFTKVRGTTLEERRCLFEAYRTQARTKAI